MRTDTTRLLLTLKYVGTTDEETNDGYLKAYLSTVFVHKLTVLSLFTILDKLK